MSDSGLQTSTVLVPRAGLRVLPLPDGGLTVYADAPGPATPTDPPTAYVMNASAAAVWAALDGRSVGAVLAELERRHAGVDLADDVRAILLELGEAGLVEPA